MKFIINYKFNGTQRKYRATGWSWFGADVQHIQMSGEPESNFEFIVEGKVVTLDGALKAFDDAFKVWEDKRALTKKPIRVLQGVCNLPSNWRTVWVNK